MKTLYLLGALFLLNTSIQTANAQSWLWARQPVFVGSDQSDGEVYSVATDNDGNVYETGFYYYADMYFGPYSLIGLKGQNQVINDGMFLVKYNSAGVVQWARQPLPPSSEYVQCIAEFVTTDRSGNVYVSGYFTDTVDFGRGVILTGPRGLGEAFIVKYDKTGNPLWARQSTEFDFDGNYNYGLALATDRWGNVAMTGQFQQTAQFGPDTVSIPKGQLNQYYLAGDVYVVKYDSNGNVLWTRQAIAPSGACYATARGITMDEAGNVIITGGFHDTISFGSQMLISKSNCGEIFTAKYDANGNILWANQTLNRSTNFWTNGPVFGNAVTTDKHGNIYMTGNFEDTIYFGATELINPISFTYSFPYGDMLVVKYDPNGNLQWAKRAEPFENTTFAGWAIATDTFDHVYVETGGWNVYDATKYNFSVKFGADTFTATGTPSTECALLVMLDTSGNTLCGSIVPIGGDENTGLAVDPTGTYIYVGADYITYNNVIIGPDTLIAPVITGGITEVPFLLRWQPCMVSEPLTASASKTDVTCHGTCNGTATGSGSGGTPPYRYRWNTPSADTTAAITGLCSGNYTLTVTDHAGDTAVAAVTISNPVAKAGIITAGKDTFCTGDSTLLTLKGSVGNIQWQSSQTDSSFVNLPGITDTAYTTSPQASAIYRVVANSGACTDTSATLKLVVNPVPVPVVTAPDTIFCTNDSLQLCTSGAFASYLWNTGGTSWCTFATAAGGYWVSVTDVNNCSAVSGHREVSVYPVPSVSIIQLGDTLFSYGQSKYQWLLNNIPIDSATGSVYVAHQSGSYAVQVTDSNGCTTISNPVTVTGVEDFAEENISIYPNPNSVGNWQLTVGNELVGSVLEVYDEQGRIVFHSKLITQNSKLEPEVPSGVYYLRISNDKVSVVRKLVKM